MYEIFTRIQLIHFKCTVCSHHHDQLQDDLFINRERSPIPFLPGCRQAVAQLTPDGDLAQERPTKCLCLGSTRGAERGERLLLQRVGELPGLAAGEARKVWGGEENPVPRCKPLRGG